MFTIDKFWLKKKPDEPETPDEPKEPVDTDIEKSDEEAI